MKKIVFVLSFIFACLGFLAIPSEIRAASAVVEFSASATEVKKDEMVTVICRITSKDGFNDVKMKVSYDTDILQFIEGGKKVSGGNGQLSIQSVGNEETVNTRTYSLQFQAVGEGAVVVQADGKPRILDADGKSLSISSNKLVLGVTANIPEDEGTADATNAVVPTPTPTPLNTNTKLKALSVHAISMSPQFSTEVLEYTIKVDCNTDKLYYNATPANSKQRIRLKGNEELMPGENEMKIVVTAESGDKRTFKLKVVKETESETKVREQEERGTSNITFSVYEKEGSIYIQNQYQFQVIDVKDEEVIPSGYVKTSVDIEGKSVPAYTMKNDLDNNYLLMYLRGAADEPTLYQYDRQEKTLQRYTGTMTQKVNQGGNVANELEVKPETWMFVLVIGLSILVLVLLIIILNMILRRRLNRGKKELNEMDF
ncbi:MAG: cadherin-like beta sandwich domain-containing protein [Eubacterium sp.]